MSHIASLGIVIPGYGHPRFLAEAVQSACTQSCNQPYHVVVVDDGCRFPETAEVVANLMETYQGKLHYLRHPNTRLPGARNAGIRFLLNLDPDLEAIYFLDADNRMEPYSLQAFRDVLGDDADIGWAYPDISFFGQVWNAEGFDTRETAPRYSRLLHLVGNISEAGSMVRVEAFKRGVLYDETMTSGFEDWEFWLSMVDAGYVGRPVHNAGFSYRRRPESMLAGSRRLEESLIAYIREKHKSLFAPRHLMQLEHEDAPAYAVVCVDEGVVFQFSDPLIDAKPGSLPDFTRRVENWHSMTTAMFFPQGLLFLTSEQWRQLKAKPRYLRWLFWQLRSKREHLNSVEFEEGARMSVEGRSWGTPSLPDRMLYVSSSGLRSLLDDPKETRGISDLPAASKLLVETPSQLVQNTEPADADSIFAGLVTLVQNARSSTPKVRHMHRRYAGPNQSAIRSNLIEPICAFEEQVPIALSHSDKRVLLAIDASTIENAGSLKKLGKLANAVLEAGSELAIIQEYVGAFEDAWLTEVAWGEQVTDLFPLQQRGNHEEFRMYLGRRISARLPISSKADVSTIGRMADTIVSIGGAGTTEMLGEIRGFGVKTAVWLESDFEEALKGESFAKMLAYEHAIDFMISDDAEVVQRLSAQGVPPGKICSTEVFCASSSIRIDHEKAE